MPLPNHMLRDLDYKRIAPGSEEREYRGHIHVWRQHLDRALAGAAGAFYCQYCLLIVDRNGGAVDEVDR